MENENIDGVYFPINPEWKRIGISVSGGADSALLSFLLCNIITEKNLKIDIHIISNVRMWQTRPWQKYNSINVFNWLKNRFPNLDFYRHENFIAPEIEYGAIGPIIKDSYGNLKSGDQISVRSYAEYVCLTNKIEAWFAGITKNPDEDFSVNGMPDRNVDDTQDLKSTIVEYKGVLVCHPFKYTTKDWIIKEYISNSILDLFNLTRSCEGDKNSSPEIFKDLDYTTYVPDQVVPECGQCFWCKERSWAKQENGLI